MSFDALLIANRGEIAARIARTAKRLGLRTVAIYTEPDSQSLHLSAADQAILLEDRPGCREPYLDVARIIDAARRSGAQAIHPGYGFLSENPALAQACAEAGLVFVGPGIEAIRVMGDKGSAKRLLKHTSVPCVPGYDGEDQSDERLGSEAKRIGLPVLIKAVAGGGGRGMRRVENMAEFADALRSARSEAGKAFGSEDVILEKALDQVRHIEVQVFGDSHGRVIALGERDCSAQRRNQKVIEEAPSPVVDPGLRKQLGEAAVQVARVVNYLGAGTVEFLLTKDGQFYFIEMNTRLQVEHPVTEAITGLDLVEWQLLVAAGEALPLAADQIPLNGAAIEVRLYAEDPEAGFAPQTGSVLAWQAPQGEGLRVDHALQSGTRVSSRYDPMIAKLIAWGPTRDIARLRLLRGLHELRLSGLVTNRAFLIEMLNHATFAGAQVDTSFIGQLLAGPRPQADPKHLLCAAALAWWQLCRKWRKQPDDWSSLGRPMHSIELSIAGEKHRFQAQATGNGVTLTRHGESNSTQVNLSLHGDQVQSACIDGMDYPLTTWGDEEAIVVDFGPVKLRVVYPAIDTRAPGAGADGVVTAPMDGKLVAVEVKAGDIVVAGQRLLVLEAMKMEHHILSPLDGIVQSISVKAGEQVARRRVLAEVQARPAA